MRVLVTGATGMVGQGVLRECLLDPGVTRVISLGRRPSGGQSAKLQDVVHSDLMDLAAVEGQLAGVEACYFCLGVTSVGKSEDEYRRLTYDLTLSIANTLHRLNPAMTFIYVSGMNTDGTERGSTMWARVKGKTENDLMKLFPSSYMFRPGYIQPMHGVNTKTAWYNVLYSILGRFIRYGSACSRSSSPQRSASVARC
jgi:uncharacterized protein YbjT (DUF2867 family)